MCERMAAMALVQENVCCMLAFDKRTHRGAHRITCAFVGLLCVNHDVPSLSFSKKQIFEVK